MGEKLEIGTKIKVKDNLVVDDFYGGLRFHNGMSRYKGKISNINGNPHYNINAYHITIDAEGYDWSKEMFELV